MEHVDLCSTSEGSFPKIKYHYFIQCQNVNKDNKVFLCDYMFLTCKLFSEHYVAHEPDHEKTFFIPYANNKGADQPAHPCSLICAFVVRCLDNIMPINPKFQDSSLSL